MPNSINVPIFKMPPVSEAERKVLNEVISSGWYVLGESVKRFEKNFASFCGVAECVSVANGTDALEIGLRSLGVRSGDSVITVANAGFYASSAIYQIGATPYYVDIDERTSCLSSEFLELQIRAMSSKPSAIVFTHLFGNSSGIVECCRIASEFGIPVLEDCAQAHGANVDGKFVGSFGSIATFSFYPTKNLGGLGDGGAIVTNVDAYADLARKLRQYGWAEKYSVSEQFGRNSRLDEIQAAILDIRLSNLSEKNNLRISIATEYIRAFNSYPEIKLPVVLNSSHVFHLFVIQTANRKKLHRILAARGVGFDVHYPIPDHKQLAGLQAVELPITEKNAGSITSLPCYPELSREKQSYVIEAVTEAITS